MEHGNRSRGGLSTNVHLVADRRRRPIARLTSPGQHGDSPRFIPVKADQADNRRKKGSRGGRPPSFDAERYKERNSVERCFNKLRQHRGVAMRYDKRDRIYQGAVDVASIRIWLRDPVM